MKIALFTNLYFPISYGSVVSVESFRLGLEKLGHEVHLITPYFWGHQYDIENIHFYPSLMYGYKIKNPIAISWCPPVAKKIQKLDFDVIHAHHPFSLGCEALRIARKNKIPIVFTHHAKYEDYTHYVPPIIPQNLIKKIVRKKVTSFANSCNVVIAPTQTIEQYMKERGITAPIEVLPTGIDWKAFQKGARAKIRDKYNLAEDRKVLISLGRIEQEKNINLIIEELFPLLKKDKKLSFMFVGEGTLVAEIKRKAEESGILKQIILTGLIGRDEIADYYSAGDVFIHASTTETQGMTIAESMAVGLPIVAIKASGVVDQVQDQETAILTNEKPGALRQEVERLLKDPKKMKKIGVAARKKAKESDYLKRAKQLEKVYKKIIKNTL